MSAPQIDPYPPAPGPSDPGEVFDAKAFEFTQSLEPRRQQMNAQADFVNTKASEVDQNAQTAAEDADRAEFSADRADQSWLAASNFKGRWSDLTGSLAVPASVAHDGSYWMLLANVADVTATEPGPGNTDWQLIAADSVRRALLEEATLYADFVNGDYRLYEGVGSGVVRNKSFSDLFDFARGSGAAGWGVGKLEEVASDTPRLVYSPETRKRQGLLNEHQITNLLPYSNDLTQGDWTANSASLSVGSNPKSTKPISKITTLGQAPAEGAYYASNIFPSVNETSRLIVARISDPSYKVRLTTRRDSSPSGYYIEYDLASGSVISSNAAAGSIVALGDGWWLLSHNLSRTPDSVTTLSVGLYVVDTPPGGVELQIANIDCVEGLVDASSPIFTSGTQLTRAFDDSSRTLGAEFNPQEATIFAKCSTWCRGVAGIRLQDASSSSNVNTIDITSNSVIFNGRNPADTTNVTYTLSYPEVSDGEPIAFSFDSYGARVSSKGQIVAEISYSPETFKVPSVDDLRFGRSRTGQYSAPLIVVEEVHIVPRAFSAVALAALTTPEAN
jgi:hypothetical protein